MLKFDADKHCYTLDGKPLVSVTRVIRDVLKGEQEQEQTYAMSKGSIVHKTLELLDKKELERYNYDGWLNPYVFHWNKFKEDYKVKWLECEMPCGSETHRFAGTIDRIIGIGEDIFVCDIKTGKSYKEYPLQTAAYEILLREDKLREVKGRLCVYVNESGYTVEEHNNPMDKEVFLSCLKVWKWKKNRV